MNTLLSVIIAISAIVLIFTVAITESKQAGLGTLSGDQTDSWGEHRGTSKKELENRIIATTGIIFVASLLVLAALN